MSLFRKFLKWFRGKDKLSKEQIKEAISDLAPSKGAPQTGPEIRTLQDLRVAQEIRTLRDLKTYSDDVRKTLAIMKGSAQKRVDNDVVLKNAIDSLYVEVGNIADKVSALASRRHKAKSQNKRAASLAEELSKEND